MKDARTDAARALLAFYAEAGVDAFVREEPVNRLAESAAPPVAPNLVPHPIPHSAPEPAAASGETGRRPRLSIEPPPAPPPAAPALAMLPEAAALAAQEAAASAATLDALRETLAGFEGCALRTMAKQLVFAAGNPQARVMLVGDAPGREEDGEGVPFVGPAGQLLDRMLASIGLDRTSSYLANVIPWRPPGARKPAPHEIAICLPFIRRQIELADPDVLVCLGDISSRALLGVTDGIRKTRGRWTRFETGTREIRAIATYHPSYLLQTPLEKRHAWRDLLAIKRALAES